MDRSEYAGTTPLARHHLSPPPLVAAHGLMMGLEPTNVLILYTLTI